MEEPVLLAPTGRVQSPLSRRALWGLAIGVPPSVPGAGAVFCSSTLGPGKRAYPAPPLFPPGTVPVPVWVLVVGGIFVIVVVVIVSIYCCRRQRKLEIERSQRKSDQTPLGAPEWGPGARGPDGELFKIRGRSLSNLGDLPGPEVTLGGRCLRAPLPDAGLQSQEGWLTADGTFGVSSARSRERLVLLEPAGGEGGQCRPWVLVKGTE